MNNITIPEKLLAVKNNLKIFDNSEIDFIKSTVVFYEYNKYLLDFQIDIVDSLFARVPYGWELMND